METYEVVVAGGGPAGSMTAKTVARRGRAVLQLERSPSFGYRQRCAEGVTQHQLHLYMEPNARFIRTEIHGVRFHAPDGNSVELKRPNSGYILNRRQFDAALAQSGADSGVTQWLSSRITGIVERDTSRIVLEIDRGGRRTNVVTNMVVGADGIESRVGRMFGLKTAVPLEIAEPCYQEIIGHPRIDNNQIEFFLGAGVAPGGYGWSFPRGDGTSNVGLVIPGTINRQRNIRLYFEEILRNNFPGAVRSEKIIGGIPGFVPAGKYVGNNIVLVGDAARQVNPLSRSGILEALRAGVLAGEVIADACANGNFSEKFLRRYKHDWDNYLGKKHRRFNMLKKALSKTNDNVLNKAAEILKEADTSQLELREIFRAVFMSNPRLILELRHLF